MQTNNLSPMKRVFIKGIIVFCLVLIVTVSLYSDFHLSRVTAFDRMDVVAEITTNTIRELLQHGMLDAVEEVLTDLSKKHNISSMELYGVNGNILAAFGAEKNKVLKPLILKKHESSGWPFSPLFQYSQFVLTGKKPLGILILYSTGNQNMLRWVSYSLIFLAGLAAAMILLMSRSVSNDQLMLQSEKSNKRTSFGDQETYSGDSTETTDANRDRRNADRVLKLLVQEKTAELKRERDNALASAKAKSDFLANMSHEIRTPMNGIIGVISLLQKSELRGDVKRLLKVAGRSADSLLLIINDILDFSKIEAGKIDFEEIPFDLREIVEESLFLYIDTAKEKDIELLCYMPLDIPFRMIGDPTRLRQVITNLVNNAVKFTDFGEVCLQVELDNTERGVQKFRFTIEDTGIGIDPDKLDSLFEMFSQADASTMRKYGGTGLGLSVCKKLVELQGGELGVRSKLGTGTTFWFTMEFVIESEKLPVLPCDELNDKNIVIFDKCETSRTILNEYLNGCRVKTRVLNGEGDIAYLLEELHRDSFHPNIIIIDYRIINNEAKLFFKELTRIFKEVVPEVYFLTGEGGMAEKMIKDGATGIIYKPLRLQQLFEELSGESNFYGDEIEIADTKEMLNGTVLLVDDEPINLRVGEAILEKIGLQIEAVDNGREAVEKTRLKKYDLVLMDIQMPEMSGLEAAEIIRAREKQEGKESQTIIAVTANTLQSTRERCLAIGIDDFIAKPIRAELLVDHLRPWLSDNQPTGLFSSSDLDENPSKESHEEKRPANSIWDRQLALEYVGGDDVLLRELMRLFLERDKILLESVKRSVAAVDEEAIGNAAHAFKGAVNHFAAIRTQKLAQTIEDNAMVGNLDGVDVLYSQLEEAAEHLGQELRRHLG